MHRGLWTTIAFIAVLLLLPGAGTTLALVSAPAPLGNARCADASDPIVFATNPRDLENLHFHGGLLYVTGSDAKLHAFDPAGHDTIVADLPGRSGAMVTGPDGALYVRAGSTDVWRFGHLPAGDHGVFATGMTGANGLAVDARGNFYVSDEGGSRIFRIPAGSHAPEVWAHLAGPNGLAIDDALGQMYVAQTTDQRATIAVLSLDDGSVVREIHLSVGAVEANLFGSPPVPSISTPSDPGLPLIPKAPDDITLTSDGNLYAAAWLTGEVLRVDPATGAFCTVASGLAQPSSVRVARGFGAASGDLFVTDFGGAQALAGVDTQGGHVSRIPLGSPPG